MAREILFRAKRIDNGEWVEGYYFCMVHDDGRHVHHFIMPLGSDLSLGTPIEKTQVEIDINTICQYTGLADKNGNKIWENDIVSFTHSKLKDINCDNAFGIPNFQTVKYQRNYVIEFVNTFCTYGLRFRNGSIHFPCKCSTCRMHDVEVIGNIFDNPELLKEE